MYCKIEHGYSKVKMEQSCVEDRIEINVDSILFFDLDGTLVDTDYANFLSYKCAFEFVKQSNFEIVYNPIQRFNRSLLKKAMPYLTETELGMIIKEKEICYNDFLGQTKLINKFISVLYKYYKTNKTILVTNCRKDRALATLNHHGLFDKFSNFFFRQLGDNEKINKFQNALDNLDVSPEAVIVFENEDIEIAYAKNAGIRHINPKVLLT